MLARADDPDAGEHHEDAVAARGRHRIEVAVADGRDRDDAPPQRVAAGRDVGVRARLSNWSTRTVGRSAPCRREERDEGRVLAAVLEHVVDERPCGSAPAAAA